MYQDIILSPLSVQDLEKHSDRTIYHILSALETETIVVDQENNILKEIAEVIDSISDNLIKGLLERFLSNLNNDNRIKRMKTVKCKKRLNKELTKFKTELDLIKKNSPWKILFNNNSSSEVLKIISSINNFNNFSLNIYEASGEVFELRVPNEQIIKYLHNTFDFIGWIKKFIIDTEYIEIKDAYLANENAFNDLKSILNFAKNSASIKLITYTDEAREKFNIYKTNTSIKIKDKIQILQKQYSHLKIEPHFVNDRKELSDRVLKTDKFIINLGHAFGAVDSKNIVHKQFNIVANCII